MLVRACWSGHVSLDMSHRAGQVASAEGEDGEAEDDQVGDEGDHAEADEQDQQDAEGDNPDGAAEQDPDLDDATQIWEHVKTLRKRVAGFN